LQIVAWLFYPVNEVRDVKLFVKIEKQLCCVQSKYPRIEITADIVNYISYAKEKGCSLTGPEDMAVEHIKVLT